LQVTGISVEGGYKRLKLQDGREIVARAVLAATGMTYREHNAEGIADRIGAGIYYGAAVTEAHSCGGHRVMIVGGGNSAGQSAIFLSRFASEVDIIVRRKDLSDTMSHYLVEQIAQTKNIRVRPFTVIERVEGDQRLERICLRSTTNDVTCVEDVDALFVFIGTRPHTGWLPPTVLRNDKGFVITGRDLTFTEDFPKLWKHNREPLALETSIAGLFAAGDVRAGAMNRVASAVGEGSMAVKFVYDYLAGA
jgi:thioredoxin reductase (NADPH)